jgi:hypothetical protein
MASNPYAEAAQRRCGEPYCGGPPETSSPTHGSLEWTGRGGNKGPPAHFTRATCPCSRPYQPAGCRGSGGTDQPSTPIENGAFRRRTGQPHIGVHRRCDLLSGTRLDLMLPFPISRTRAAAALPSVIGWPDRDFFRGWLSHPWQFQFGPDYGASSG